MPCTVTSSFAQSQCIKLINEFDVDVIEYVQTIIRYIAIAHWSTFS